MRRTMLAALTMAAIFGAALAPGRPAVAGPAVVAFNRCDSRNINDIENQIRSWEKHPPGDTKSRVQRMNDLQDAIAALGQERSILDAVCPESVSRLPFNEQIAAVTAWALALEVDITIAFGPPCPSADDAIPIQITAGAWLELAAAVNDAGGTVPQSVAEIVPKVQARAQKVGLALPGYADTSAYWRQQIEDKSKAAVQACITPGPSAAPTEAASPEASPSTSPAATLRMTGRRWRAGMRNESDSQIILGGKS